MLFSLMISACQARSIPETPIPSATNTMAQPIVLASSAPSLTPTPSPTLTLAPPLTQTPLPTEALLYGGYVQPAPGLVYKLEIAADSYQRLWRVRNNREVLVSAYVGQDLVLSPNLQYGAYISQGDVWLLELGSGEQVNLTETPDCSEWANFAWSPDNTKLLYFGCPSDSEMRDIYVVDLSTKQSDNLTNTPDRNEYLFIGWWEAQPDLIFFGSGIPPEPVPAYAAPGECHTYNGRCNYFLSSIKPDGTDYRVVDNVSGLTFPPALAPDGKTMAYDGGLLYNFETGFYQIYNPLDYGITPGPPVHPEGLGLVRPVWSPSGKQLLWLGHVVDAADDHIALYLFDLEADAWKILHRFDPYYFALTRPLSELWTDIKASWSPDGRFLAIISDEWLPGYGAYVLQIFDEHGNLVQRYEGVDFRGLTWSPASDALVFGYYEKASNRLVALIADVHDWQLHPLDIPANARVIQWTELK